MLNTPESQGTYLTFWVWRLQHWITSWIALPPQQSHAAGFFSHLFLPFLPLKSSSISLSPVQLWFTVTVFYLGVTVLFKSQVKMGYTFSFYNLKYQANEMKIKNGIFTSSYDLLSSKQLSKGICLYLGFKSKQTFQLLVFLVSPIFADKAENRLLSPVCYTILFFLLILLLLLLYLFSQILTPTVK